MKRRTLLRLAAGAIATRPLAWSRAAAPSPPLSAESLATLREVAGIVLPSEIGRKGVDETVDRFQRWLRGYRAGAEMDPGYGFTRIRSTGPYPGRSYEAQLAALDAEARRRGGRLGALAPHVQRAMIEAALEDARIERLPARPDGGHVVSDLMSFYFHSTQANDLCYRAHIGKDTCRALPGSEKPPGRFS